MAFLAHLNRSASPGICALILFFAPLHALSNARAEAVEDGPSVTASAVYDLTRYPESLLDPVSDGALRVTATGNLAQATRIAVVVPGVGHRASEFDHSEPTAPTSDPTPTAPTSADAVTVQPGTLPAMAKNLLDAATESAAHPDPHVAVIAWLGYVPPSANVEALESTAIPVAAANLAALQRELEHSFPAARVTWACHSFGTLVCASALVGADPDAVVLLGSPGVTYKHASDLPTDADVFAALGDGDPIRLVGALDAVGGGFGPNPAATQFGAVRLPTDPGAGHSDYYRPGSSQLTALAQVVLGEGRATRRSQETLHEEAGESWPIAGNERLNRQAVASKRPSGLPSY